MPAQAAKPAKLDGLQQAMQHRFHDLSLLQRALTHRSTRRPDNERLEFLGDAVLGMVVAESLLHDFPDASEGELSRRRAMTINKEVLARAGRGLDLGACITLGIGERKSGGARRDSILADGVEALIAALYLDAGLDTARAFIRRHILDEAQGAIGERVEKDFKTRLQERTQAARTPLPCYTVLKVAGKGHDQEFTVSCEVQPLTEPVHGRGRSKRAAEQAAARTALESLPP